MKRILFLLSALVVMATMIGCSEKKLKEDSYFVSGLGSATEAVLLLRADGTYLLNAGSTKDSGNYSIKKDVITFTPDDGVVYEQQLYKDKYVLHEKYDGGIPKSDTFDAVVNNESRGGGVIMTFREDGTVTRQIYITNISDQRIAGTYTREGDVITCKFSYYGIGVYVIKDNVLYDAYQLKKDYVPPTPKPTELPTNTPTPTSEADNTPSDTPTPTSEAEDAPTPSPEE